MLDDYFRPFIAEFAGCVEVSGFATLIITHSPTQVDGKEYLQLQNLLKGFGDPCVMDCKIGVRYSVM